MQTKLFKSKIFYYIFMVWVGLDFFNSIFELSKPTEFLAFTVIKYFVVIISFLTFLAFFINLKYNHNIFKIYIYLRCIILSLFFLLFAIKDPILYGVSFDRLPVEFYMTLIISLLAGIALLYFYRKYKVEYNLVIN